MTLKQTPRSPRLACAGTLTLLAAMSCRGAQEPGLEREPDPSGSVALAALIVSNPAGSAAHTAFPGSGGSAAEGFVYASLPPGSIPNGRNVVIETRRTGARVTAEMVEGGFDPVLVVADGGDTLDVRVTLAGDLGALAFVAVVPRSRPPVVVRTDPPPKKRDVPLNAVLLVVFSEPIDPATLTASAVRLTLGGVPVVGTLAFGDATHLTATFTPTGPLNAAADYVLQVTREIEDLDREALEAEMASPFSTAALAFSTARIAFVSTRSGSEEIYVADADGSGVRRLTIGTNPAWSWDGRRIAFDRGGAISVIDADGANERWLAEGSDPSWSPDDRKIVFRSSAGISVVHLDGAGSEATLLLSHEFANPGVPSDYGVQWPAWSPDGQRIVFVSANYVDPWLTCVMGADGSDPRPLVSTDDGIDWIKLHPTWSPDGARLAFGSRDNTDGGPPTVWVVASLDASGSGGRTIHYRAQEYQYAGEVDWSPDQRLLAFTVQTPPPAELGPTSQRIFVVDLEAGIARQLIPDAPAPAVAEYSDYQVAWSRVRP